MIIHNLRNKLLVAVFGAMMVSGAVADAQAGQVSLLKQEESNRNTFSADIQSQASLEQSPMVFVVEQSLPDFLRQAARRNGYQITLSPRIRGTLTKMSLPLDIKQILQILAPQFDLKWHFQQRQVHVSVSSESKTRLIYLGNMTMEDLEQALVGAGLKSSAYDLSYVEESNSVIVNAPVSYIASVELIAESYNKNAKAKADRVKVIRFGNVSK